jgi:prepilin-type N-terminal cleavage/methylation domain-containing protein
MRRSGVSLLELLVALTIVGIAGMITVPLVVGTGRVASRATAALVADRTTASLAALLRHDLRLATTDEIIPTTPAMLWLARPVGEGPVCATTPTTLLLRATAWDGDRLPVPGRDVVQFLQTTPTGEWVDAPLVAASSGSCPDGAPAMWLEVAVDPTGSTHLRVLEPARLTAYSSGASHWLGLAGPGDPNQPFAGPVVSGGMSLAVVGGALQAMVTPSSGPSQVLHFPAVGP